jgi:hypothetical protein
LLSIARLKMTRSRLDRAISRRTRMDQTCFGSRGFFWPMSNPLFQGRRLRSIARTGIGESSATPPTASLYRERIIYNGYTVRLFPNRIPNRPLLAQSGGFASEPEAVALDRALRFESSPNSRPSMVCLCRASCFCRLLSSCRCCRSSRRLRRLINVRRHAGTATASCRAITSHRITAFQITPRKLRFRAWRAETGVLGISIQPQVTTGTMANCTISAGLAFTAVATMAAASALAGRGRRSGRSGIAAD